jgi:signal peptidase I
MRWGGLVLFRIAGDSMAPTLRAGEIVLCTRYAAGASPRRGEVVVAQWFSPPTIVKRVIAAPGERLPVGIDDEPGVMPEGKYLLAGEDSGLPLRRRLFGPVARTQIEARVRLVLWPCWRWRRAR